MYANFVICFQQEKCPLATNEYGFLQRPLTDLVVFAGVFIHPTQIWLFCIFTGLHHGEINVQITLKTTVGSGLTKLCMS